MEPGRDALYDTDVLVEEGRIVRIGTALEVPESTLEIDAAGGILVPGMIDTHRHMWQTAQRGYGAEWTLTNYFYFYYINHVNIFRPEDIYAGNLLAALESLDAGVTTTVDWSHGLRTTAHADAAMDALEAVPGRFVLAYGNYAQGPWEWTGTPGFRSFIERRIPGKDDLLTFQIAFDMTNDPAFPGATLSADRAKGHLDAHAKGETVADNELRTADVLGYATLGGARAIGLDDKIGTITHGKRADLVLIKSDRNPAMFPIINPAGHVVQQAGARDVHTVLVDGRFVKHNGTLLLESQLAEARRVVEDSLAHVRNSMDAAAWTAGLDPNHPDIERIQNPYRYREDV